MAVTANADARYTTPSHSPSGRHACHRPHFPAGESAQASRAGMPYNSAGYFRDMGVAPSLVADMQAIEPQRMKVLTPAELKRYRLH